MGMGANPFAGMGATGGPTTGANPPPLDFSALLGGAPFGATPGTTTTTTTTAVPPADPATRFAPQLQQLQDMGFNDRERNIQALQQTGGNVNAAVDRLLSDALG